ncbi:MULTISPECIES: hypothetical protein [Alphaproteobacteria]|uniref:hypothetical protein n=1 Tax=Alphaproteobacteria TaxID=28211 RepID=UPI0010F7645E|nr:MULTISPECIES: hypothetical protein [Alphaproteobacteria]
MISADEFENLKRRLPAATSAGLFETYRISESTWRKLRQGKPVARDTLSRIFDRYEQLSDCR